VSFIQINNNPFVKGCSQIKGLKIHLCESIVFEGLIKKDKNVLKLNISSFT